MNGTDKTATALCLSTYSLVFVHVHVHDSSCTCSFELVCLKRDHLHQFDNTCTIGPFLIVWFNNNIIAFQAKL